MTQKRQGDFTSVCQMKLMAVAHVNVISSAVFAWATVGFNSLATGIDGVFSFLESGKFWI